MNSDPLDLELVITGLVYGLTFLVGFIGNSLIVYSVIHYKRMKSLSNIFLANLATADLMLILFCVPVKFAQLFSHTWTFGEFLCKFVHYIQNLGAICSVYTLTGISIERYYAIMYPMQCRYICTMSQTRIVICLTWVCSIFLASPVLWIQILIQVGSPENPNTLGFWCIRDWGQTNKWRFYEIYMLSIILIVPVIIMSYCYGKICAKLRHLLEHRGEEFPAPYVGVDASAKKMSQVIKMLVVVVVVFIFCWTPILVTNLLASLSLVPALNYGPMKAIRTSFNLFSYANSCVNPIIYGFMSRNFRQSFQAALEGVISAACCCHRSVPDQLNNNINNKKITNQNNINESERGGFRYPSSCCQDNGLAGVTSA